MIEDGWSARLAARQLGHSDCVVRSGSERFHLHENQAQDALDRPVVENDESRFNFSSDDNRVRVWRPCGECLNPDFALLRHTASTLGVMVLGVIAYNARSPLVFIHDIMATQRYVHDILQPHVLSLMQLLP
ncbi:transposable element Tcb1 transposase [Trichonephila clavipes]|nr:transposable element Tcb1 transposase [Trichonephila clavipes]